MHQILRTFICFILISFPAFSAENMLVKSVENKNIGHISFSVPKDWPAGTERHHTTFGTTFYRIAPLDKRFEFEIQFNDLLHMQMDALVDKDLEIYIETNMAGFADRSIEGKIKAYRFGSQRDGVYARLTDKSPKSGEFIYFTQGARLLKNKQVVLFNLLSNDADESLLKEALATIESVQTKK